MTIVSIGKILVTVAAIAVTLSACTVYEAPPGGRVTVVPGYDYDANTNASPSVAPTKSDAPDEGTDGTPRGTP